MSNTFTSVCCGQEVYYNFNVKAYLCKNCDQIQPQAFRTLKTLTREDQEHLRDGKGLVYGEGHAEYVLLSYEKFVQLIAETNRDVAERIKIVKGGE